MTLKEKIHTAIREEALDMFERASGRNDEKDRKSGFDYARGLRAAIDLVNAAFRDHVNEKRRARRRNRRS